MGVAWYDFCATCTIFVTKSAISVAITAPRAPQPSAAHKASPLWTGANTCGKINPKAAAARIRVTVCFLERDFISSSIASLAKSFCVS